MYSLFGQVPELNIVRRAFAGSSTIRTLLAIAVATHIATPVVAQHNIPLTLAEAEDKALISEPGQQALQAKSIALKELGVAAGELPDPMLRVGLNNFPIQSGGFTTEGMTSAAVGLRQIFPAGKSRAVNTHRFDLLSNEMQEIAEVRGRNVLTAARNAWLDLYYWDVAHELVTESRPFFDDLATITRSYYAVGRKSQQDVLRAELELSRLDDRLIEIERRRSTAGAALSEWIGQNAMRPVARKLPGWDAIPPLESMQAMLLQHPMMRAADSQIEAYSAGVELASENAKPGWALDIAYNYREGSLPSGTPRSDMITLGVTVDLPFFRKRSNDSNLAAALQERRAARSGREETLRGLQSQLMAEYARWEDLTRRLSLYDTRILSQTRDHAEASLLGYQSDKGNFADVMRGYISDLNTRIEHIRLQVDRAQSYAVLANLGGFPQ